MDQCKNQSTTLSATSNFLQRQLQKSNLLSLLQGRMQQLCIRPTQLRVTPRQPTNMMECCRYKMNAGPSRRIQDGA